MRVTQYKTILKEDSTCELIKVKAVNYDSDGRKLDTPSKVYDILCNVFEMHKQTEEYLYLLCLASGYKLTGVFELSHGTVNATLGSTRDIFQKALLCNASCIIIAHNHLSGNTTPSRQDLQLHETIKKAADIMSIALIDNIIVGDGYYAFSEHNLC